MFRKFEVTISPPEVEENLPFLVENGLGVELMLYDIDYTRNAKAASLQRIGNLLRKNGITPTAHGPFYDLNPGSRDSSVRSYTLRCFSETLEACSHLGVSLVVFHTGLNPLLPITYQKIWLDISMDSWKPVVREAEEKKIVIAIENTFARDSSTIEAIVREVSSEWLKVCFDAAHVHVYSRKPIEEWLDNLDGLVRKIHLNDNAGEHDDHLSLGEGNMDIVNVFRQLEKRKLFPIVTLELDVSRFEKSLDFLEEHKLWKRKKRELIPRTK
ncbi:MAG: sugar phosphate isomerase/epimerase family protein [Candidatus Eisenbacteria bacterium]|nr:sugar phosphate isomerase/epimerase family protein [Candidatus Eisenbacteria bacterium]